jgi:AcrR family transcriptional regulator
MRMRLPAGERKAQILHTAAELFSQQGYEGTKTSQIAREAGVNEAIIFRHFTNKEELYWAVLENSCSCVLHEQLKVMANGDHDPAEALIVLGNTLMERMSTHPQLLRLLYFAALENHKLSHRFFRIYTANKIEELADYIRTQVKHGVFREDIDPLLAARGFLGSLIYHVQIQELFGGNKVHPYETRFVVENLVRIWIQGMQAEGSTMQMLDGEEQVKHRNSFAIAD